MVKQPQDGAFPLFPPDSRHYLTPIKIKIVVCDDGVGIFNKIQVKCGLENPRHAVLELAKGKLTTDPERHTGEGVFFTTRMFDRFSMMSGEFFFCHSTTGQDWLLEGDKDDVKGTYVTLEINPGSERTTQEVFDRFASNPDECTFSKTIVPVDLARFEGEALTSRSQAKRLLARFDRFEEVVLDFQGVTFIGPAFADEIFRVFNNAHPKVRLVPINTSADVKKMIQRSLRNETAAA